MRAGRSVFSVGMGRGSVVSECDRETDVIKSCRLCRVASAIALSKCIL